MSGDQQTRITTREVGHLHGHKDWVTAIETGHSQKENQDTQVLITASRDRTILIWKFNQDSKIVEDFGAPVKSLTGHSHFISDLSLTKDNNFLLSSSWDMTIRLWDLTTGKSSVTFKDNGHTKEVLSCTVSSDGRYIISSGADRKIKLWNTKGNCKHEAEKYNHQDWVSKVRFVPSSSKTALTTGQFFASVGWDGYLKIWNSQNFTIKDSFKAHEGSINAITISPGGSYIVTGGKDKKVKVFDISDVDKATYPNYDTGSPVNCLAFNPRSHWIAVGTQKGWEIWDFENKCILAQGELKLDVDEEKQSKKSKTPKFYEVTSIAWNTLGNRLFVGFTNGVIKVHDVTVQKNN